MKRLLKTTGAASLLVLAVLALLDRKFEDLFLRMQLAGLRRALADRVGDGDARRILDITKGGFERAFAQKLGAGPIMRYHAANLRFNLALYQAIEDVVGRRVDPVSTVHELMWESGLNGVARLLGVLLGLAPDPPGVFARSVKLVNDFVFPEPFWEREYVEVPGGVGFDYTRCPYFEFCSRQGVPELTRAFCDLDWKLAGQFAPMVEMRREHTLGNGDDSCDFRYFLH